MTHIPDLCCEWLGLSRADVRLRRAAVSSLSSSSLEKLLALPAFKLVVGLPTVMGSFGYTPPTVASGEPIPELENCCDKAKSTPLSPSPITLSKQQLQVLKHQLLHGAVRVPQG